MEVLMITRFSLSFDTTNDSFVEDLVGEVERIFADVRAALDGNEYILNKHKNVYDFNGNVIGTLLVEGNDQ
jgi:hypothetical protein